MPPVSDEARERLANVAKRRRAVLGLSLNDTNAKAAGTSKGTWQRVERGRKIHDSNYVKIDGLLQWAPGSCVAVLEGGEPIPVSDMSDPEAAGVQKSPLPQDALDARGKDVVRLALLATARETPADEIREMSERVWRDLREGGFI